MKQIKVRDLIELDPVEYDNIILEAAGEKDINPGFIEKDIWICLLLENLFKDFKYKNDMFFKGGTSLSKIDGVIQRFSEDIDIAFDWRLLGYTDDEFFQERGSNQRNKFVKNLNDEIKEFIKYDFFPNFKNSLGDLLLDEKMLFIDENDGVTICFKYPSNYKMNYVLENVRLELGVLADRIPLNKRIVKPYVEECFPSSFKSNIEVIAVDHIRTLYEKMTILHKESNRLESTPPTRYSRHLYDVYKLIQTDLREESKSNLDLLKIAIDFNKQFYGTKWARHEEIFEGKLKLIPIQHNLIHFENDYEKMGKMLFGDKPSFAEILNSLKKFEIEMNEAIKNYNDLNKDKEIKLKEVVRNRFGR